MKLSFLNNKSLGRQNVPENSHLEWKVNYEPGILQAHGYNKSKEIIHEQVETTGEPAVIELVPANTMMKADGKDISVITIKINDSKGRLVPIAGNEITFSLNGPGKIIGVGNGDPSCHEPDKYIEKIEQVSIKNLKINVYMQERGLLKNKVEFDDSKWPNAIINESWNGIIFNDTCKNMILQGKFNLPAFDDKTEITIYPKSLGEVQTIYINGVPVLQNMKRDDPNPEIRLDQTILYKGENVYTIVGKPFVKRYQWDNLNTNPGIIKIEKPAEAWKRSAFNGLAQIIVQSSFQPGEINLKASSPGLKDVSVKIQSSPVERPMILP